MLNAPDEPCPLNEQATIVLGLPLARAAWTLPVTRMSEMILSTAEIHIALDTIKVRFPEVTDGRYHNEIDGDFLRLTLWGTFTLDPDDLTAKRFFITFTQGPDDWQGDLTVGQLAYFWTCADARDAYLLDTPPCATLEEAIAALKKAMRPLAQVVAGD